MSVSTSFRALWVQFYLWKRLLRLATLTGHSTTYLSVRLDHRGFLESAHVKIYYANRTNKVSCWSHQHEALETSQNSTLYDLNFDLNYVFHNFKSFTTSTAVMVHCLAAVLIKVMIIQKASCSTSKFSVDLF